MRWHHSNWRFALYEVGSFFYASYFSACIVEKDQKFKTLEGSVFLRLIKTQHTPLLTVTQAGESNEIKLSNTKAGRWISGKLCLTGTKEFIINETSTSCMDDTKRQIITDVKIKDATVCVGCGQGTYSNLRSAFVKWTITLESNIFEKHWQTLKIDCIVKTYIILLYTNTRICVPQMCNKLDKWFKAVLQ